MSSSDLLPVVGNPVGPRHPLSTSSLCLGWTRAGVGQLRLTGDKRHNSAMFVVQIVTIAPAQAPPRLCRCVLLSSLRNGVYRLALGEAASGERWGRAALL